MSEENFIEEKESKIEQFKKFVQASKSVLKKAVTLPQTKLLFFAIRKNIPSLAKIAIACGADTNAKNVLGCRRYEYGQGLYDDEYVRVNPFIMAAVVVTEQQDADTARLQQVADKLAGKTKMDCVAEYQVIGGIHGSFSCRTANKTENLSFQNCLVSGLFSERTKRYLRSVQSKGHERQ